MKRRTVLATLGATVVPLTGCTQGSGSNRNDSDPSIPMTLSLTSVDNASEPLSFEVTISNEQLSTTGMPILAIAVKNTGDETMSWSYAGQVSNLPFPQGIQDSRTGGLVIGLKEEVEAQLLDVSDGCSRVDHFVRADGIKNIELTPGQRIEKSYAIAGVDGNLEGDCPEPGEYRMEHDIEDYGTGGFTFQLNETQSPSNTETPTPSPSTGQREVRISSIDDVPTDAPLDPSVEVLQSSITAEHTARMRVTMTNTANQPVWNTNMRIPAFSAFITEAGPERQKLLLLKPDEQYDTASAECWRAELDEHHLNHAYTDVVTDIRYDAGESKATEFDIYGHPENADTCLAPGEYPIENQYAISDDTDSKEVNWEYRWGFRITVADS